MRKHQAKVWNEFPIDTPGTNKLYEVEMNGGLMGKQGTSLFVGLLHQMYSLKEKRSQA